ncbi:MAG: hypothetical protein HY648_11935 [Acidobacteria bacterium]|nr:hypothetical protein [Acidobacteriota bacterium]
MKAMGLLLGCCLALTAVAGEKTTVNGWLVDQMCASMHASEGEKFGTMHKRECALMPDCVKSGYGVLTAAGEFLKFDKGGDKKAEAALKASQKTNDLRVTVTGEKQGAHNLKVASLKLE